jgi:hypothetical protein
MKKVKTKITTTIEVLGHELTRAEAEALYHELGTELKMVQVAPLSYPVYIREPRQYQPFYQQILPIYGTSDRTVITCGNSSNITALLAEAS